MIEGEGGSPSLYQGEPFLIPHYNPGIFYSSTPISVAGDTWADPLHVGEDASHAAAENSTLCRETNMR